MKTIADVSIKDKRVLVRVDFNVPLNDKQEVSEDSRIRAVLPTLKHLVEGGAKLIIMSHLGRPKGKPAPQFSLSPVAARLEELLEKPVRMLDDCIGESVKQAVEQMSGGDVILLENLRFYPGEEKNDPDFAARLAENCDIYVNDAFAVSHRAHASVEGVVKAAPVSVAGFLLKKEIDYFNNAVKTPKRPLVAIIGGAKVSSKLGAVENLLNRVDKLIIGGAMANTFLKSRGVDVGQSKVEEDLIETAGSIIRKAKEKGVEFLLPVDAVVADRIDPGADIRRVSINDTPSDMMILDIGPETSAMYARALNEAGTIVWNGPMGVFEIPAFSSGTMNILKDMANSGALTIIGGGDTDAAVHGSDDARKITYISTGGGAFLELMEGKTLPGVAALI